MMLRRSSLLQRHLLGVVLTIVLAACSSQSAPEQIGSAPTSAPTARSLSTVAPPDAATLVKKVLPVLRENLEGDDVTGYGFRDRSELARMTLGRPIPAVQLWPDAVHNYQSGQRLTDLVYRGASEWFVPVRVEQELRLLARVDDRGQLIGVEGLPEGRSGSIMLPPNYDDPAIPMTFVEIPQIGVKLLVMEQQNQELIFLVNRYQYDPDLDAKAHRALPADDLMPALKQALVQHLGQ
jgi:hypothetical protein